MVPEGRQWNCQAAIAQADCAADYMDLVRMSDVIVRARNKGAEALYVVVSILKEVCRSAGDTPRGNIGFETPRRLQHIGSAPDTGQ